MAGATQAQQYPSRPVRIVVPLSPGGFADTPTRILTPRLSEQLGKQFFVDNRPGAGGTIGWDFVTKQPADGYTLAITGTTHLISSHLYKKLQYDAFKDFTHISMMAVGPYVLVVNPKKTPVSSVKELIAAAKAEAGVKDYEATLWLSIAGPAGMPKDIVQRLSTEITKALKDPDLQAKFREAGLEADSTGGEELLRYMRAEDAKWGKVVKDTGAQVN